MKPFRFLVALALWFVLVLPSNSRELNEFISLEPTPVISKVSAVLLEQSRSDQEGLPFEELSHLVKRAFLNSPIPLKAELYLEASKARLEEAKSSLLPKIVTQFGSGRIDYGGNSSANGRGDRSIIASQLIYDFGLSPSLIEAADLRMHAAEKSARIERTKLVFSTIQALLDGQRAIQGLDLARAFAQTRQQFLNLTSQRAANGFNSDYDVQRARAKLLESLDEVHTAQRKVHGASSRLVELFGAGFSTNNLPRRYQLPASAGNQEARSLALNIENHASYQEMQCLVLALSNELKAEQSRLWGSVNAEAAHSLSDVGSSFERKRSSAAIVFRSDLSAGFVQRARIQQASARLGESEYELERLKRELTSRIEVANQDWEQSQRILTTRRELLMALQETEFSTRELFLFARASLTDVFRAQEDLMNAAQRLLQASFDRQLTWYQWKYHKDQLLDVLSMN